MATTSEQDPQLALLCRVGALNVLLPADSIVEVLRPPSIDRIVSAPAFVAGLCIVRGAPVPAVDLSMLIGGEPGSAQRLILLRVGERRAGLLVDSVEGLRSVPMTSMGRLPPLLGEAGEGAISLVGTLDSDLLLVLAASHIVPDTVFEPVPAAVGAQ